MDALRVAVEQRHEGIELMKQDDFVDDAPGHLVQDVEADKPFLAFVPAPLPPSIPWDDDLVRYLDDARGALGELAGLCRTMPNPHILIRPFIRREAVSSSRIEGTEADITDLYVFEAGQRPTRTPRTELDVAEVRNYIAALEFGLDRVRDIPVTTRLMREIHERLMHGVRGEFKSPGRFRTRQVWIGTQGLPVSEARFVPPPAPDMENCLKDLEEYLNNEDTLPGLVRVGLMHYQFEAIHPFIDGNGRIGRLLITLLLVHWNLLPLPLLYLSEFFERNRSSYYDLLFRVSANGDWGPWLKFFLAGVTAQSTDAIDRAKRLQELQMRWGEELSQAGASALQRRLMDCLFESPVITIPSAQELLGTGYQTARYNVHKLLDANILAQLGDSSYNKLYYAPEILKTVSEGSPES